MRRSRRLGYRFHPTEGELMIYLKRKVMQENFSSEDISELDIYKFAPWHLPDKSGMKYGDRKCYFFCPRAKKYGHRTKIERKTEFGKWKSTGKDKPVVHKGKVVGMRKILTFSASKEDQTSWVMHEYRIEDSGVMDAYVVCKIFEKGGQAPRNFSYKEEDCDCDDDGSEAVDISSGLSVPPVGCSSASGILENLASTSKEIPQIASGSIALVETTLPSLNDDDGITLEDIPEDGDEFQATVHVSNNTDQPDNLYEPYIEEKDLDEPLRLTIQDLMWLHDAHISRSSQFFGRQENIPLNYEGYYNGSQWLHDAHISDSSQFFGLQENIPLNYEGYYNGSQWLHDAHISGSSQFFGLQENIPLNYEGYYNGSQWLHDAHISCSSQLFELQENIPLNYEEYYNGSQWLHDAHISGSSQFFGLQENIPLNYEGYYNGSQWLHDAHISGFSQFFGLQENIPLNYEGYYNGSQWLHDAHISGSSQFFGLQENIPLNYEGYYNGSQ